VVSELAPLLDLGSTAVLTVFLYLVWVRLSSLTDKIIEVNERLLQLLLEQRLRDTQTTTKP